jgi:hypothetical protein
VHAAITSGVTLVHAAMEMRGKWCACAVAGADDVGEALLFGMDPLGACSRRCASLTCLRRSFACLLDVWIAAEFQIRSRIHNCGSVSERDNAIYQWTTTDQKGTKIESKRPKPQNTY